MAWQQEGGGAINGAWGQRPWAQGPKKPIGCRRRGSGQPPNLDELIRMAQEKFRSFIPGGFGLVPVALAVLVIFWLFESIYMVQPDETGVVLRFGKFSRLTAPGLHMIMWPVETVETPRTESV